MDAINLQGKSFFKVIKSYFINFNIQAYFYFVKNHEVFLSIELAYPLSIISSKF